MIWAFCISGLVLVVLAAAYLCFKLAFAVPKQKTENIGQLLPKGEQYEAHHAEMETMLKTALALPYEDVWITSGDGLRLHGQYYHTADGAPVQIMFHGYRSMAELDFSGGLPYAVHSGYNVLLVDQRAHGKSEGGCLTFGVKERCDCLAWTEYAVRRFGADTGIILYGMSMGVAMAPALSGS